jgi:hypothetical protein
MQVMLTAQCNFELTNESRSVIKSIPSSDDIELHFFGVPDFGATASLSIVHASN